LCRAAGRLRVLPLDDGWPLRWATERSRPPSTTAARRAYPLPAAGRGRDGRPLVAARFSPGRTTRRTERRIVGCGLMDGWAGPVRLAPAGWTFRHAPGAHPVPVPAAGQLGPEKRRLGRLRAGRPGELGHGDV